MRREAALLLVIGLCASAAAAEGEPESGILRGRLVRGTPALPVAGSVQVLESSGKVSKVEAGPDGYFEFRGLRRLSPCALSLSSGDASARFDCLVVPPVSPLDLGELAVGAPTSVAVEVRGADGGAVEAALVESFREVPWASWARNELLAAPPPPASPDGAATTAADGRAAVPVPGPGEWWLRASAKGVAPAFARVVVVEGASSEPVSISLGPTHSLAGRVAFEDGKAAAGVVVRASPSNPPWVPGLNERTVPVDAEGKFRLEGLAAGDWHLFARAGANYRVALGSVTVPSGVEPRYSIPRGATLKGRVVDDATNAPVGAAVVAPQIHPEIGRLVTLLARTTADGGFEIADVAPGTLYYLRVHARGYQSVTDYAEAMNASVVLAAGATRDISVRLRRGVPLRGVVRGADGRPVRGALVSFLGGGGDGLMVELPPERTDDAGNYEFPAAPAGPALVLAKAPGHYQPGAPVGGDQEIRDALGSRSAPQCTVKVPGSGEPRFDIRLAAAASVEGVVTDGTGQPLPGLRVSVWPTLPEGETRRSRDGGRQGVTDREGRFRVADIRPGASLFAWAVGTAGAEGSTAPFALADGERKAGVKITVVSGATLSGRVRLWDGKAPAGADVRLAAGVPDDTQPWEWERLLDEARRVPIDAEGKFASTGLRPGIYSVIVGAEGCAQRIVPGIRIAAGVSPAPLEIQMNPGRVVAGRVRDADGRPIPGAKILLAPRPRGSVVKSLRYADDSFPFRVAADAEGAFRVDGLDEGTFRMVAWAPGSAPLGLTTKSGEEGLEIVLSPGLAIAGRVIAKGTGAPVVGLPISATASEPPEGFWHSTSTRTDEQGRFSMGDLPPGAFDMEFGDDNNSKSEFITLKPMSIAAGTVDLVVELDRAWSIAGRVEDEEGAPPGVPVTIVVTEPGPVSPTLMYAHTAADGSFRVSGLRDEEYDVEVKPEASDQRPLLGRTVTPVRAGTKDLVVRLARGGYITGTVLGHDGKPVKGGVEVGLSCGSGMEETSEDGSFRIGPLDLGKRHDVWAGARTGASPEEEPSWTAGGVARGAIAGGEPVVVKLQPGGAIAGRVLDEEGVPPPAGTRVTAWAVDPEEESLGQVGSARTAADGSFVVRGLGDLEFRLEVGLLWRTREVLDAKHHRPGAGTVELRLRKTYTLRGTLVDPEGRVPGIKWLYLATADGESVAVETLSSKDGSFEIADVPRGRYVLSAQTSGDGVADLGEVEIPCDAVQFTVREGAPEVREDPREDR